MEFNLNEKFINIFKFSRKEWSYEEDITLLKLIIDNGRKWSLISKKLTGRNEHNVKNRYISILRFLKKNGKIVNSNCFEEVLEVFKNAKRELKPLKKKSTSKGSQIIVSPKIIEETTQFPYINFQKEEPINLPKPHPKIDTNFENPLQNPIALLPQNPIFQDLKIETNYLQNPNFYQDPNQFFYEEFIKSSLFFRDQILMKMLTDISVQNHFNFALYPNSNEH